MDLTHIKEESKAYELDVPCLTKTQTSPYKPKSIEQTILVRKLNLSSEIINYMKEKYVLYVAKSVSICVKKIKQSDDFLSIALKLKEDWQERFDFCLLSVFDMANIAKKTKDLKIKLIFIFDKDHDMMYKNSASEPLIGWKFFQEKLATLNLFNLKIKIFECEEISEGAEFFDILVTCWKGISIAMDMEDFQFSDNVIAMLINPLIDEKIMKTIITIDGKITNLRAITVGFSNFGCFQNHYNAVNID